MLDALYNYFILKQFDDNMIIFIFCHIMFNKYVLGAHTPQLGILSPSSWECT